MTEKQMTDSKRNIIAIISYIMAGLAVISIIVFLVQKFSSATKIAALREKGNSFINAEDYESAIKTYNEAIAIDPDNMDIISRIKYAEMMNKNISFTDEKPDSTNTQDAAIGSSNTNEGTQEEPINDAAEDVPGDDPLKLGEEGMFGLTWNDILRDDAMEYVKEYALKDLSVYDESGTYDNTENVYYVSAADKPERYYLSIENQTILWSWQDNSDYNKSQSGKDLSIYPDSTSMTLRGLSSDECRFFGITREEFINNELTEKGIYYSESPVTQEDVIVGSAINISFSSIQGIYTTAAFWYDTDGKLDQLTYTAKKK